MSSKLLKFQMTSAKKANQLLNDVAEMQDVSFDTINKTLGNMTDIKMLSPEESIQQSLKNLLNLPKGGNVLFPTHGESISEMLFNPALSAAEIQTYIISYLSSNEPRINILRVDSEKYIDDFNEQIITVNVKYSFKNSNEIHSAIVNLKADA